MGVLLDTHVLYWLVSGTDQLSEAATLAIARAQASDGLLVSAITAWELGVIAQKPQREDRPDLGQLTPQHWFQDAVRLTGARIVSIGQRISLVSAEVAMETGHKDPGDCFLMATARVRHVPIVTRDRRMIEISRDRPEFLSVIAC